VLKVAAVNAHRQDIVEAVLVSANKYGKNNMAKMPNPNPLTLNTKVAPNPINIKKISSDICNSTIHLLSCVL